MCLGLPCRVDAVTGVDRALVRAGERTLEVSLLPLGEPVTPGDWLLVHAGFALHRLSEEQAADALTIRATPAVP